MKKLMLFAILFCIEINLADARGIECDTTQDCYDFYKDSSYTCEYSEDSNDNGKFCGTTIDCGYWQFAGCEGDSVIWKNDCGDKRKEQCLGCREIQTEEREICEVIDEVTGEKGNCRIVGGGMSYECPDAPPLTITEKEEYNNTLIYAVILILIITIAVFRWHKFSGKK